MKLENKMSITCISKRKIYQSCVSRIKMSITHNQISKYQSHTIKNKKSIQYLIVKKWCNRKTKPNINALKINKNKTKS